MQQIIIPSVIDGIIDSPPSKSVAQRAVAMASLARGCSQIYNPGDSQDLKAAIKAAEALGAIIEQKGDFLEITGNLHYTGKQLDCQESGLSIRMFSALAAILNDEITLTGKGSLLRRPMHIISDALQSLGVYCVTTDGYIPVIVHGPVPGGKVFLEASVSSQVLTGILIAGPYSQTPLELHVKSLTSRPYIDLTLEVMKAFGIEVYHQNYEVFYIPSGLRYLPGKYHVEGDWSGAAFMLVAGAIAGKITVRNLRMDSLQADKAIFGVLEKCGAKVSVSDKGITVERDKLRCFSFNATHCPDLFPPLVALAACCEGTSAIEGVHRLWVKESDRAAALQQEFRKLGIDIRIERDTMLVTGGRVNGATVFSHADHRIAMACAIAALAGSQPVTILESQVVDKSFPEFYGLLEKSMI